MGRSETPFRLGDAALLLLGGALLILAVPFGMGAISMIFDDRWPWPLRIVFVGMLGLMSYLFVISGWHLFAEHAKAVFREVEDDYDGPRWPDVTVKQERRLRARARWRRRSRRP